MSLELAAVLASYLVSVGLPAVVRGVLAYA